MNYLDFIILFSSFIILVPLSVLTLQVLLSLAPMHPSSLNAGEIGRPSVAVLVPAHNEADVICKTITSIIPQLLPGDQILVVADNCSDDTADIARKQGASVVERNDKSRMGKGYALDYGIKNLSAQPPDVLIIVDADCTLEPGAISILAQKCNQSGKPTQSQYLMGSNDEASLKIRIAEFAWIIKNKVRPLGMSKLDLPCQLTGSGMAFPWDLIKSVNLANSEIVEDMKLGLDLGLLGYPPRFVAESIVHSEFPVSDNAQNSQRKRWEHGHLSLIIKEAPRLIKAGFVRGDIRLLALALDLSVPPISLLFIASCGLALLSASLWQAGILAPNVANVAIAQFALLLVTILLCWFFWAKSIISVTDLLKSPMYALKKIPLYIRFISDRQKDWVRTDRK